MLDELLVMLIIFNALYMKKKISILFVFICILFIGCKKQYQNQENLNLIFIPLNGIKTVDKIELNDALFVDSCVFVSLETSESGLIGEIGQIEYYNDKYYIYDGKMDKLKVFDSMGKFLFDVGGKGQGLGEYLAIKSFFINEKENKIGVFDPLKLAVHEYNLDGYYLRTVKHNQKNIISISRSKCIENYIYCFSDVSYINDITYFMLSAKDYSIVDKWLSYPVKVNTQMVAKIMENPFSVVDGRLHYTSLYSDTIYSYNNGKKQPYLLIEKDKPNIPPTYFDGKIFEHEPTKAFIEVFMDNRYSPGFTELFETDRYLIANFRLSADFYIVDKDKMETFHIKDKKFPGLVMPTSISDNKLIKVFDQQEVAAYQDYIKSNNLEYPEQIRELMSKYDVDEDNPILIIYHMKKSEK